MQQNFYMKITNNFFKQVTLFLGLYGAFVYLDRPYYWMLAYMYVLLALGPKY